MIDESIGRNASRDLEKGGLLRVTELLYLERETTTPLDFANSSPAQPETIEPQAGVEGYLTGRTRAATGFNWRSFNETIETEFRRILQATYNGSLDMPELEGARSLDDIIESHKSANRFVSDRWRLGQLI